MGAVIIIMIFVAWFCSVPDRRGRDKRCDSDDYYNGNDDDEKMREIINSIIIIIIISNITYIYEAQ